jgi:hypothetical protein
MKAWRSAVALTALLFLSGCAGDDGQAGDTNSSVGGGDPGPTTSGDSSRSSAGAADRETYCAALSDFSSSSVAGDLSDNAAFAAGLSGLADQAPPAIAAPLEVVTGALEEAMSSGPLTDFSSDDPTVSSILDDPAVRSAQSQLSEFSAANC